MLLKGNYTETKGSRVNGNTTIEKMYDQSESLWKEDHDGELLTAKRPGKARKIESGLLSDDDEMVRS